MTDIKIFVSMHKKFNYVHDNLLIPIQVGCISNDSHLENILHDDDAEDNISSKNRRYCELTAQYYAYKHIDADYYGFFHYRRYLSFSNIKYCNLPFLEVLVNTIDDKMIKKFKINELDMRKNIEPFDLVVPERGFTPGIRNQYNWSKDHFKRDLDFCIEVIKKDYPYLAKSTDKYMRSLRGYFRNMFIMKREYFMEYSEMLFDVLKKHEKKFDCKEYSPYGYRVSGFLAERICGIYLTYLIKEKKVKYKILQSLKIKNV